jgi:hypothetical protein
VDRHGRRKDVGPEQEFVIDVMERGFFRVIEEQGPHGRYAGRRRQASAP